MGNQLAEAAQQALMDQRRASPWVLVGGASVVGGASLVGGGGDRQEEAEQVLPEGGVSRLPLGLAVQVAEERRQHRDASGVLPEPDVGRNTV